MSQNCLNILMENGIRSLYKRKNLTRGNFMLWLWRKWAKNVWFHYIIPAWSREQNEQKSTSILTPSQAMKQYAFVDKVETAICAVKFLFWPRNAIMIIHVKWDNWGFLLRGNTSIRQCVHSWHSSRSCLVSIPFKSTPTVVATGIHHRTAKCVYRK